MIIVGSDQELVIGEIITLQNKEVIFDGEGNPHYNVTLQVMKEVSIKEYLEQQKMFSMDSTEVTLKMANRFYLISID